MSQVTYNNGGNGPPPIIIPAYTPITFSGITNSYTVLSTDYFISVNAQIPGTVFLPAAPLAGQQYIIKDRLGTFSTNNVTINGNGHTIDQAVSYLMAGNFDSIQLLYENGNWEIF